MPLETRAGSGTLVGIKFTKRFEHEYSSLAFDADNVSGNLVVEIASFFIEDYSDVTINQFAD